MSVQCDIARLAIRKHDLMKELDEIRTEIKNQCRGLDLPFAVEVDGQAVTVAKPQWSNASPQTKVLLLHKGCDEVAPHERHIKTHPWPPPKDKETRG